MPIYLGWLWIVAIGLVAVPTAASADEARSEAADIFAEAPDPARALGRPIRGHDELYQVWATRRDAVKAKDKEATNRIVDEVLSLALEHGIRGLDAFAAALLREARAAADAGRAEEAWATIEQAWRLSPGMPAIEEVSAEIALKLSAVDFFGWLSHTQEAMSLRMERLPDRQIATANIYFIGLLVLGLTVALFFMLQLLRHGFGLYHDLGHIIPGTLKILMLGVVALAVVVPLFLGYGPALLVFPLAVMLWPYQRWGERAASGLLLVLFAGVPWGLRAADNLSLEGEGLSRALETLQRDPWDGKADAQIAAAAEVAPKAWWVHGVRGRALKARGDLDEGLKALALAEAGAPDGSRAKGVIQNNLANALFATGRVASAEKRYLSAKVALPAMPEPRFNLHRLYQATLQEQAAEAQLQQASGLDSERVAMWVEEDVHSFNRRVKDLALSANELASGRGSIWGATPFSDRVWVALAGPVPVAAAPISAVVAVILCVIVGARQRRMRLTRPCPRCGHPVRQAVPTASKRPDQLCDTCTDLFVRSLPMERRIRFAKEEQVDRYQRGMKWITRVSGVILPGMAGVLRGQPVSGLMLMAIMVLLLVNLLLPHGVLYPPGALHTSNPTLIFVGMGIIWLAGLFSALRAARKVQ